MPEREDRLRDLMHADAEVALLAAIVESSQVAIVGVKLDRSIETWNRAAEALYGYARQEQMGRSMLELEPPDRIGEEEALYRDIENGGSPPFLYTVRRRKDGRAVHVALAVSAIRHQNGELRGFSHIARDVSTRVHSEQAAAHMAAIVDSSDDAIIGKTVEGVIQSWNAGAERLYGFAAEEVVGQPMSNLLPKGLLEEEEELLRRVRNGERVQHFDTVRIHKEGKPVAVSLTISPIHNAAGEIIGISHVARDISETKQMRERLQISQKMEALGRLAGGVAHDFNNLLTVITGYGALLQRELKDNPECEDMANEVMCAADKAAELTRQLLVFSRHQVAHLQALDLNEEVLGLKAILRRLIGDEVILETRLTPGLQKVRADPGQVGQILINLAANARDAMPGGGRITIQTEDWVVDEDQFHKQLGFSPGRYVRILFSDTGHGMDAITRARIFEPFFTTKEVGKGTGLGLATVYGIIKQSGGQIAVYSEPQRGTTFAVYLPCTEAEQAVAQAPKAEVSHGSETILLVEDEPGVRKLAFSILQSHGYTVLTASHADEAITQADIHAGKIRLLLTDILMPGKNGQELAALLSAQRSDLRVIFMSGFNEHVLLDRILSEPGARFLQKPFTPAQLLRTVREVLD